MYTSLLFVPGDSEKKLEKSAGSDADVLMPDLEDSVAQARKEEARGITAAAIGALKKAGKQVFVRVNALDTGLTATDIAAVLPSGPDGIVLPKCTSPEDLFTVSQMLGSHEGPQQQGVTQIIAIATETAGSVLALTRPGWAHPRLSGMMWGAEDLAADIGATRNFEDGRYAEPFRMARNLCLMAARAANVIPIDTIYADFRDLDGLRTMTREARADGFDAKAAIHPAQVTVINEAFSPSDEELEWAHAVVAAFEKADAGVASLDGKMLDMPHLRSAQKILARAVL